MFFSKLFQLDILQLAAIDYTEGANVPGYSFFYRVGLHLIADLSILPILSLCHRSGSFRLLGPETHSAPKPKERGTAGYPSAFRATLLRKGDRRARRAWWYCPPQ